MWELSGVGFVRGVEISLGWELSRMGVDNSHVSGFEKKTIAQFNKMKMIIVLEWIIILFKLVIFNL